MLQYRILNFIFSFNGKNQGNVIIVAHYVQTLPKSLYQLHCINVPFYILSLNDIKLFIEKHSYFTNY